MIWYEKIIAAHTAVTKHVSHGGRLKSDRYFVWQEDGGADMVAGNRHVETGITGTTDLFTKKEFDPWKDAFEQSLNNTPGVSWYLSNIQFEPDTGFWHYEWVWVI